VIDKNYRKSALRTYGEACEICGHRTSLEIHHIDYQEHQKIENKLKDLYRMDGMGFSKLMEEAKKQGYDEFRNGQLSKNDDTGNLAVLCGNCHSFLHLVDYGKLLLNAIKPRIKGMNK
jgi:predicted HNH restriction endonuclease